MLKILLALMRKLSARNSLMVMVLSSDIFSVTCPGPSRKLRPASPNVESAEFTQVAAGLPAVVSGWQNAAVLNHSFVVGSLRCTDSPGTAFARNEPLTPR